MNDPLNISFTGLHSTEIAKQRRMLDIHMRNAEIRARFHELRGRMNTNAAKSELSKTYSLANDTIHKILWPS